MLNSTSLEVAIGMSLVYLLMSVLCTAINETIAGLLGSRARLLEKGIQNLFTEGTMQVKDANGQLLLDASGAAVSKPLSNLIYEHGLVQSLYRSGAGQTLLETLKAGNLPSYIPSRTFAVTLFDLLFGASGAEGTLSLQSMLKDLDAIPPCKAKEALISIVRDAGGDAERTRKAFAAWFDDGMDRVSGLYKRRTQAALFAIGLTLTLLLNVNSITLGRTLWSSPATRAYTVAAAEKYTESKEKVSSAVAQQDLSALQSLGLPIGWNAHQWPWQPDPGDRDSPHPTVYALWLLLVTIFGWLLTAMATSLGAPFWFDLLNQFMVVRSTIKPREKSDVEASKDPTGKATSG